MALKKLVSEEGEEFQLLEPDERREGSKIGEVEWQGIDPEPDVIVTLRLPTLSSNGATALVDFHWSYRAEYLNTLRFPHVIPLAGLPTDIVVKLTDILQEEGVRDIGRELAAHLAPDAKLVIDLTDGAKSAVLTVGGCSKKAHKPDTINLKKKLADQPA